MAHNLGWYNKTDFPCSYFHNIHVLYSSADFGMDEREMMREASTFEEDIMHGATASNLLLEAEPGPANLPDKSNHMEYDDFGDASMGNSDGGMLGEPHQVTVWVVLFTLYG